MAHRNLLRSLATLTALLPLAACHPLNPQRAPETALWVPYAEAGLATISRSTMYAVQHAEGTDLLIYEVEDRFDSGRPASRLTWLIQVPSGAPLERPLDVGPSGRPASGWLFEQISGKPSHAAPLEGTLTIAQRTADAIAGVVNVYAVASEPMPGAPTGGRVRLARRLEWQRQTRDTYGAKEPETRGGITYQEQKSGAAKHPD